MIDLARYKDAESRSWTASCSLALHLLLGELIFVRQRWSLVARRQRLSVTVECGKVIGHCLNIRRMQCVL